jgi:HEPN domain-containing protein
MRPRERFSPDDPREWLNRARSNLALARSALRDAYPEDLCFEAQQAAEKAIKAVLIHRGLSFPLVHDRARLLSVLAPPGEPIPEEVRQAVRLTRYALATRYPGITEPVTEEEYTQAVALAEQVVQWAEARVCAKG